MPLRVAFRSVVGPIADGIFKIPSCAMCYLGEKPARDDADADPGLGLELMAQGLEFRVQDS